MTPTRFRECLTALHWTQRGLADFHRLAPVPRRDKDAP